MIDEDNPAVFSQHNRYWEGLGMEISYIQPIEWNLGKGKITELFFNIPYFNGDRTIYNYDYSDPRYPDPRYVTFNPDGENYKVSVDWDVDGWHRMGAWFSAHFFLVGYSFEAEGIEAPAPVPLPAAGMLLIGGLGCFGAIAARRKSRRARAST
ncbi:VPLPA-CTERM sorting domain-containing protein [uncultured Shimia sp.]|uniref:VPLPA-CTERM sorting domain-containing protein n=1 Tax=uncultured Shimia sp. TaxID=573152 RepID=UPI00262B2396|nr:VPLPA-CTERM sorting domain-containing protein [uncultured Shimia sp.]